LQVSKTLRDACYEDSLWAPLYDARWSSRIGITNATRLAFKRRHIAEQKPAEEDHYKEVDETYTFHLAIKRRLDKPSPPVVQAVSTDLLADQMARLTENSMGPLASIMRNLAVEFHDVLNHKIEEAANQNHADAMRDFDDLVTGYDKYGPFALCFEGSTTISLSAADDEALVGELRFENTAPQFGELTRMKGSDIEVLSWNMRATLMVVRETDGAIGCLWSDKKPDELDDDSCDDVRINDPRFIVFGGISDCDFFNSTVDLLSDAPDFFEGVDVRMSVTADIDFPEPDAFDKIDDDSCDCGCEDCRILTGIFPHRLPSTVLKLGAYLPESEEMPDVVAKQAHLLSMLRRANISWQ